MRLLDKLSNSPSQKYTIVTDAGDQVIFALRYLPTQQSWMLSIAWGEFSLNGIILVISPNILRSYMNNIPFGFMVTSEDTIEPSYLDDFTSGRIKIYVMNADDVALAESTLSA